jgi:T5SS/PEP-CTERM-associated repeat protein
MARLWFRATALRQTVISFALLPFICQPFADSARAQHFWRGPSPGVGSWNSLLHWSEGFPPNSSTDVWIVNGGTVRVNTAGNEARDILLGRGVENTPEHWGYLQLHAAPASLTAREIDVGYDTLGTLSITAGASLTTVLADIGHRVLSSGAVSVDGIGSLWTNTGGIAVGTLGTGNLTITAGGAVLNSIGYIGSQVGSIGAADVDGMGSTWMNAGELNLGYLGTGSLSITDGGQVSNTSSYVGGAPGATGTATISGSGSQWINSANMFVGGRDEVTGGDASVLIQDRGLLEVAGKLRVWPRGTVTIDGGTLRVDSNKVEVVDGVLRYVRGTLHLTDSDGYILGENGPIGEAIGGSAVVFPNGSGLIVDQNLAVPSNASLTAVASAIQANQLVNNGLINVNMASLTTAAGLVNNADLVLIDTTVEGPVSNAVESTVTVLGSVDFNGLVSGSGIFFGPGTANFSGGITPGASPAEVAFEGNLAFNDTNTLYVEIGGTILGSEYDSLSVAGNASLAGIIDVSLIDNFSPTAGQQFTILTANSITDNGIMLAGDAASSFNLLVDSTQVVLEVVGITPPGDYNGDAEIDAADYVVWRQLVGQAGTGLAADGNGDGIVDQDDYDIWRAHFGATAIGRSTGSITSIPEPLAATLSIISLVALLFIRRRP